MLSGVVYVAGLVGFVSLVIAGGAWRSLVRTGNRTMGFVLGAFVLIAIKNFAKATFMLGGFEDTEAREVIFSLMDLGAVALIAYPMVVARE